MSDPDTAAFRMVFEELRRTGVLLGADQRLPSVVSLVAGESVHGSWWAHPAAHEIHNVSHLLGEDPEVVIVKLISGKDTYVHRTLWPALVTIGLVREPWQLEGLSDTAQRLFDEVSRSGGVRSDEIPWSGGRKKDSPGETVRQLQRRLLVHAEEFHTDRGAHAKRVESWERWAKRMGLSARKLKADRAKSRFEKIVTRLNQEHGGRGRLPWH